MNDINVNSAGNPFINLQTEGSEEVKDKQTPGPGNLTPAGPLPGTGSDPSYGVVLNSLAKFMPQITGQMLDVLLLEVTTKLKEAQDKSQQAQIKVDQEMKRTALAEKSSKLEESQKKLDEAAEKEKNTKIWDIVKLVFQAIAAVASIIAGIVAIATGAGAGLGVALLVVGVVGLIMTADAITKMASDAGVGIAGHIAKAANADKAGQAIADMVFGIVMAVVAIVVSIVSLRLDSAGIAAATLAKAIAGGVSAATGVITGLGDGITGFIRYDAAMTSAEGQKLQAQGKELEAIIQQLDDFIDQALQRLMASTERFHAMLDSLMESLQDTAKTVSKVQFTG